MAGGVTGLLEPVADSGGRFALSLESTKIHSFSFIQDPGPGSFTVPKAEGFLALQILAQTTQAPRRGVLVVPGTRKTVSGTNQTVPCQEVPGKPAHPRTEGSKAAIGDFS